MNVQVNNQVRTWMTARAQAEKNMFNSKCTEAAGNDLSTWRNVGRQIHDYRVSGNFRCVATKTGGGSGAPGDTFTIQAIYRHAGSGGKQKVTGNTVGNY